MQWLVRSQDRKFIIPIESVECVTVGGRYFVRGGGRVLGEYETEQRCIEVVDEMEHTVFELMFIKVDAPIESFAELNKNTNNNGIVWVPDSVKFRDDNYNLGSVLYKMPKE